jgi:hypothetical protein
VCQGKRRHCAHLDDIAKDRDRPEASRRVGHRAGDNTQAIAEKLAKADDDPNDRCRCARDREDSTQAVASVASNANPCRENSPVRRSLVCAFIVDSEGTACRSDHLRRYFTRQENRPDIVEPLAMYMPEVTHFGLEVDELDAVRETVMRKLDVFVMEPVAFEITRMDTVQ